MAAFCKMCNKKIGIFDESRSVANFTVCVECYSEYLKVFEKIDNAELFEEGLARLQTFLSGAENAEAIINHLRNLHQAKLDEMAQAEREAQGITDEEATPLDNSVPSGVNSNIGPFEGQDLIYSIEGVRGRHIDIYPNKVVISTKVTLGSLLAHNATDGEKTVYLADCIGLQFKLSGFAIGYIQFETASGSDNNANSNFMGENSFTFDTSVISNERMIEVADYIKSRLDAIKQTPTSTISVADELLKMKQLLDMGVLTQDEFDMQKNLLLNRTEFMLQK